MSTVAVALHPGPAAGFDEPFDMLGACHERVARMLGLLQRLREHLQAGAADEPARQAAQDVMRCFELAAPHHHQDEERHVFPRLQASGDAALQQLAARLQDEHTQMAVAWAGVRPSLQDLADGRWSSADAAEVFARRTAFDELYRAHAQAEDEHAFPVARALSDAPARAAMGQEMARRRGVKG